MFSHLEPQFDEALKAIREAGTYKAERVIAGHQGPEISVEGKTLLNFCANNYLGLAGDPRLSVAAKKAIDDYGFGMASVRFICGTGTVHKELESAVAKFFGFDDAILYGSCFDANGGLFETLLEEGDAVFSDELNHASIIDGVRLSKAERFRYKHADMADLEAQLQAAEKAPPASASAPARQRRKLIATDGVFSMDGDTASLGAVCDLAEKYQAMVMVDDSHGSGVLGKTGRGTIEARGVGGRVDILTSTFGKALGGASGGFTAARGKIVEYLRQRSRPYLFSNTVPPVVAATALYVLGNFDTAFAANRTALTENTRYFRAAMEKLGFALGGDGAHPINPVMLGEEKLAIALAEALFARGIYVRGFTYPVVPKGKARVRVQLSAAHTKEHLDRAIAAFGEAGKELGIIP